ncbi:5'(3')-deoxyribonucleotidase [Catalinimonas alkaloidigena]|uniref:5' nucleotidase, NT5C type n=1 Tax=Catalinimonas alkaloidigena TaxID=1075417 RepID=UPI002405E94D|nr:hypothetical protein [Catalinimonas alkaloidigena]MDF9794800.1 5'(3')-deoxyribonucleotidase [Catalinimonas alkaloidigena]
MHGKFLEQAIKAEHSQVVREYLFEADFFKDLEVMPESEEVIRAMHKRYEIFIVSAAMEFPDSLWHKYNWLQEYPFLRWKNFAVLW